MAIEQTIICDFCRKPMEEGQKRAEIKVTEYSELHSEGYVIPSFRDLHFHWVCYEKELPKEITNTDG